MGSTYSNDGGNSTQAMLDNWFSSRLITLRGKHIASRTKHALVRRGTHVPQDTRALARALSPARTHSAPQSSKAPGVIKVMPLLDR